MWQLSLFRRSGAGTSASGRGTLWRGAGAATVPLACVALVASSAAGPASAAAAPAASPRFVAPAASATSAVTIRQVPKRLPLSALNPINRAAGQLAQQFPENYGGLRQNADGSFTVLVVGARGAAVRSRAQQVFGGVPGQLKSAGFSDRAPRVTPRLSFASARFPLSRMLAARDSLAAKISPRGVWGVGIDEAHNRVVLNSDGSAAGKQQVSRMVAAHPAGMVTTRIAPMPRTHAGRLDDSAPWNGGDRIFGPNRGSFCTTNLGFRNQNTGQVFTLTAGHCGVDFWFNTADPGYTPITRLVGGTVPGSMGYRPGGTGVDAQELNPAGGASCISWGGISIPALGSGLNRLYVTGWYNPGAGAPAWLEGSFGLERRGTVLESGLTFMERDNQGNVFTVINGFSTSVDSASGDSGGPIIGPTIFGPLLQGMITAGGYGVGYGQLVDSLRYVYQANPVISRTGTSC